MTGNCCDPPPLRKPSHHVVRPHRSLSKSERGCAAERKGWKYRGDRTPCVRKWTVRFYQAQWKGDISVMLYSSLWHFKLIKASNNYAEWKKMEEEELSQHTDEQCSNFTLAPSHSFPHCLNFIPLYINSSAMTPASHCERLCPWNTANPSAADFNFFLKLII